MSCIYTRRDATVIGLNVKVKERAYSCYRNVASNLYSSSVEVVRKSSTVYGRDSRPYTTYYSSYQPRESKTPQTYQASETRYNTCINIEVSTDIGKFDIEIGHVVDLAVAESVAKKHFPIGKIVVVSTWMSCYKTIESSAFHSEIRSLWSISSLEKLSLAITVPALTATVIYVIYSHWKDSRSSL